MMKQVNLVHFETELCDFKQENHTQWIKTVNHYDLSHYATVRKILDQIFCVRMVPNVLKIHWTTIEITNNIPKMKVVYYF